MLHHVGGKLQAGVEHSRWRKGVGSSRRLQYVGGALERTVEGSTMLEGSFKKIMWPYVSKQ